MKNKIKKIIPLILCFVIVAGSCLTVNAAKVSSKKLQSGDSVLYKCQAQQIASNTWFSILETITISDSSEDVYTVSTKAYCNKNKYTQYTLYFVSKSPFKYSYFQKEYHNSDFSGNPISASGGPLNCRSLVYNGVTYYYLDRSQFRDSSYQYIDVFDSCLDISSYVNEFSFTDSKLGEFFEKMYLADFVWDDGKASVYDTQPTAEIEPPKNLSIYRGYSNADKQYKFQMQWDKPADTNLNVEVMYNIHWKEGTGSALGFGTHVYKKYQHLVYDDGHSAQINKLQYLEDDLLKGYFESQNMDVPSVYNIDEIYVRFAKEIDGVIHYSLWRKIDYMNLDEGNGFDSTEDDFQAESSTGAFDTSDNWIDQSVQNGEIVNGSEKEDAKAPGLDANGDNITNVNKPIVNPDSWDGQFEGVFSQFTNAIKSAFSFVGEFPAMLSEFFGFLPASVLGCISTGLVMVVVLRFLGR